MVAPAGRGAAVRRDAEHAERRRGFDERLKHGGRQRFWLQRRMSGGWSVRAPEAECAGGYRAEGWCPELSRDERRALCRASSFEPPPVPSGPE